MNLPLFDKWNSVIKYPNSQTEFHSTLSYLSAIPAACPTTLPGLPDCHHWIDGVSHSLSHIPGFALQFLCCLSFLWSAFFKFVTSDRLLSSWHPPPPSLPFQRRFLHPDECLAFTFSPLGLKWLHSLQIPESRLLASPRGAERRGSVSCRLLAPQLNDIIGISSIHLAGEKLGVGGWESSNGFYWGSTM